LNEPLSAIPENVRAFLREHVASYEQLEVLLFLHTYPEQTWSPAAVAAELHIADDLATSALDELSRRSIVDASGQQRHARYRLGSDDKLRQLVDLVARAYADNHLDMVRLMSANAIERIRATVARAFIDAFLIGRKREDS
jgi:hypothetical protein